MKIVKNHMHVLKYHMIVSLKKSIAKIGKKINTQEGF